MKIGLLLYPSCLPAGLFAGLDFFKAANLIMGKPVFDARLVGLESSDIICGHGQILKPQITVAKFDPDVIVLPGFWSDAVDRTEMIIRENRKLQTYLNKLTTKKSLWSYCTGVIFHGHTGRLDGKTATATWWLARNLVNRFPKVKWNLQDSLIFDIYNSTASGANGFYAIYEEALKNFSNKRVATEVQKYLMSPPRLDINDPFHRLELDSQPSPFLVRILKLIQKQPAYQLSVNSVATELGMSSKTLARQLKKEVPYSPSQFFRLLKLRQCGEYLINSNLSVSEVCSRFGFEDESNFSRSFKSSTHMTPAEYRRRFKRF